MHIIIIFISLAASTAKQRPHQLSQLTSVSCFSILSHLNVTSYLLSILFFASPPLFYHPWVCILLLEYYLTCPAHVHYFFFIVIKMSLVCSLNNDNMFLLLRVTALFSPFLFGH